MLSDKELGWGVEASCSKSLHGFYVTSEIGFHLDEDHPTVPYHSVHSRATRAVTTVRIVDAKSSTVKSLVEECDRLGAIFVHLQFSVA